MSTSTVATLTTEVIELLGRVGKTEDQARDDQIRYGFDSLRSYLVTRDRENNLELLQELYDEAVKALSRQLHPHEVEVDFIMKFKALVAELKGE